MIVAIATSTIVTYDSGLRSEERVHHVMQCDAQTPLINVFAWAKARGYDMHTIELKETET